MARATVKPSDVDFRALFISIHQGLLRGELESHTFVLQKSQVYRDKELISKMCSSLKLPPLQLRVKKFLCAEDPGEGIVGQIVSFAPSSLEMSTQS
jgi:hypothetical protein